MARCQAVGQLWLPLMAPRLIGSHLIFMQIQVERGCAATQLVLGRSGQGNSCCEMLRSRQGTGLDGECGSAHTFAMTFSAGPMLLSCRHDAAHDCLAGDDLDLWAHLTHPTKFLMQRVPQLPRTRMLQFLQQPETRSQSKSGLLWMAECAEADDTQQWKLVPSLLSQGSVSLQSVADPSMCIWEKGKALRIKMGTLTGPQQCSFHRRQHLLTCKGSMEPTSI